MSVVANVAINVDSRNAVTKLRQVQTQATATQRAAESLNKTNDALAASFTKSGRQIQTAANGMRYFVDAAGRARKENGQFVTTAEAAAAGLRKQGQAAQQATASVSNLGGTVRALLKSFALIQSARFVFVKTAELESQARSLQVLTGSAEKAGQIIKELQQLGAVTPFTSSELIDSAKRLQAFGVEADKVVETTRRLADVSGATGAELQGLVTAYGQVQAKGRLQGEELLQFQERGVALQQELRKQYNLSGEEFQEALSKGKISAEAVEFAIQNLTDAGGKYANGAIAQSDTLNGRFSTLQDGIEGLARAIGAALTPAIKGVLNEAIFAINTINQLIATGARAKSFGLDQRGRQQILKQAQQEAQDIVNLRNIRDPFERNRQFQELAAQRERDLIESFGIRTGQVKPQVTAPQSQRTLPPLGAGTASKGRKGKSDAEKAAEKAAREAEKLAQEIQRSLELGDRLGTEFSRQVLLLGEANEIEQKRLRIQFEYEDRAKQIAELKNTEQQTNLSQLNDEIRRLEIIDLQTEALKKQAEEAEKLFKKSLSEVEFGVSGGGSIADIAAEMQQSFSDFIAPANQVKTAAESIGTAFSTSFKDIVSGSKSAQEAIADFFNRIATALLDYVALAIAQYIALGIARAFAGGDPLSAAGSNLTGTGALAAPIPGLAIGARANGGSVSAGSPYIVGERGPELFVPGRSGTIVPNDKMGGDNVSVIVNVDAKGTNVQGNDQQGNQLGRAISAAVQQELIKQKRPGGLLA